MVFMMADVRKEEVYLAIDFFFVVYKKTTSSWF